MKRTHVSSTTFVEVGYDAATQTLELVFVGGRVYRYFDVSRGVYEALLTASSIGHYYNQAIKHVYRYARL